MSKVKVSMYKAAVADGKNPFRKGTAKAMIFDRCLEREQFTREEFDGWVLELAGRKDGIEGKFTSVQSNKVLPMAWWNELCPKAEVIVEVE